MLGATGRTKEQVTRLQEQFKELQSQQQVFSTETGNLKLHVETMTLDFENLEKSFKDLTTRLVTMEDYRNRFQVLEQEFQDFKELSQHLQTEIELLTKLQSLPQTSASPSREMSAGLLAVTGMIMLKEFPLPAKVISGLLIYGLIKAMSDASFQKLVDVKTKLELQFVSLLHASYQRVETFLNTFIPLIKKVLSTIFLTIFKAANLEISLTVQILKMFTLPVIILSAAHYFSSELGISNFFDLLKNFVAEQSIDVYTEQAWNTFSNFYGGYFVLGLGAIGIINRLLALAYPKAHSPRTT